MSSKNSETKNQVMNHCNICNKYISGGTFKFKSHLHQHEAVKSRFYCSYCNKGFYRSDAYKRHLGSHMSIKERKEKLYFCDYCDRGFVDKRNLIRHLRVHDDSAEIHRKTYSCEGCGVSYCEKRLLNYHIRKTHFNLKKASEPADKPVNDTWIERVNKSEMCVEMTKVNNNTIRIKKIGNVKTELKEALKTEKPCKEYILSEFGQNRSQYSKAICDYCNKEMLKKSLISHLREKHLNIYRFKCETCKNSFSRHYIMVNHVCGKYRKLGVRKN